MTTLNESLYIEIFFRCMGLINKDSEINFSVYICTSGVTHSRKGALSLTGVAAIGCPNSGLFLRVQTISWVQVVPHFGYVTTTTSELVSWKNVENCHHFFFRQRSVFYTVSQKYFTTRQLKQREKLSQLYAPGSIMSSKAYFTLWPTPSLPWALLL